MKFNLRVLQILGLLIVFNLSLMAQERQLPTKQELDIKEALFKLYNSSPSNKINGTPSHLMTTGPEQNCNNALTVCQQTYTQNSSYTGYGNQELSGTCLITNETNSVWYTFTVQNSGTFGFILNTANDYDFALYNITASGCASVPGSTPVRCNYSATNGTTGLDTTNISPSNAMSYNASQPKIMPGINVTAGQTFALIINNFSANSNGYSLTFGGSAQIFDQTPPLIASINASCTTGSITLTLNEPVRCNSIEPDGSDFTLTGPSGTIVIDSAVGSCAGGAGFTNQLTITYNTAGMTTGTYTLTTQQGTDANVIFDNCNNQMLSGLTQTFSHIGSLSIAAVPSIVCAGGSSTITVTGGAAGSTYSWSPVPDNDDVITVSPIVATNYNVTVTHGACSSSITQPITIGQPPLVSVTPPTAYLCAPAGTTTLTATSVLNGTPCANCTYNWTGTVSQTDIAVANSVINPAGQGTYSVTVTSPGGCVGNTAVSNVVYNTATCDVAFVSVAGGGTGLTPSSPTDLLSALTLAACNTITIKMQVGDYSTNTPIVIGSGITLEGGYNTTFTQKTSAKGIAGGFPTQGTRIIRTTTSPEGVAGNFRLTALNVSAGSSNFRFQDLMVTVDNAAAGSKTTNYGIYLGNGCSNYDIVRCVINAGTGSAGIPGTDGTDGVQGGNGSTGANSGGSGAGGNGGTSAVPNGIGGAGGNGGFFGQWYDDVNGNGSYQSPPDVYMSNALGNGTDGFGGGANMYSNYGTAFGGGTQGIVYGSETCVFSCCDNPGAPYRGGNGSNGLAGVDGSTGANGTAATFAADYFMIGGDGSTGTDGTNGTQGAGGGGGGYQDTGFDEDGAGGGGGGGAGQRGTGATPGTAAGGAFGVFSVSQGANGNIIDCDIIAAAGTIGTGGTGGTGRNGGTGANGGTGCDGAAGGRGGNGGKGGDGGDGGDGAAGLSCQVCDLVGTTLTTAVFSNFSLAAQPVIVAENVACINTDMDHTTTAGGPNWTNFGSGSNPVSAAGSPAITQYTTLGRKDLVMNGNTYTGFNNMLIAPPSTGNILASATTICPGSISVTSSAAGTVGFSYLWSVLPSAGVSITSPTASTSSITFPNTGSTTLQYTLSLVINTACCGDLTAIDTVINVNPIPADPTVADTTTCRGGSAVFTATAPAGASFDWYANLSGGSPIHTGSTYSVSPVSGTQSYFVQSIGATGCPGNRVEVIVTDTIIPAPTAINVTECEVGNVQVGATSVTGSTTYNWYDDAVGTTLLQTGPSLSYGVNVPTVGTSVTVYVSTTIPGCDESALIPVIASVANNPIIADTVYSPASIVCPGTDVTISINASGGNGQLSYLWSPNGEFADSINITNATNSTSYNVIVSDGTCSQMFAAPLIVGAGGTPPTITGLNTVCEGDSIILVTPEVSGATYSWNGPSGTGISTNDSLVIPASALVNSGSYTVFVDDGSLCANPSAAYNVGVNPAPSVTVNPIAAICSGLTASISANSATATSYSWSTGATSTGVNTADVSPTVQTTYTVTGTDGNGCSDTTAFTVNVNALPTPTVANESVCLGNTATVSVGNVVADETYAWSPAGSGTSITVTPAIVGTETVSVVATNTVTNCVSVAVTATVTATAPPTITATTATPSICLGESATLTGTSGLTNYSWSSGGIAATETVTPGLGTTTYTLTGDIAGCSNTATVDVTVNAIPAFTVNNATICNGSTANLTATDNTLTYVWQAGVTSTGSNTATANPTAQTTYTVTGTNTATTCSLTATFTVDVNALPLPTVANQSVCLGDVATVSVSNVVADETYAWTPSGSGSSITVTPTVAGTETVSVVATNTVTNCPSLPVTATVTATALPTVTATAVPTTICSGAASTLTGGGATSYTWSGGVTDATAFTPASTATYTVTGTTGVCSNTATVTVTVNQSPQVAANVTSATCNTDNGAVNATISSGTPNFTYNWVSLPGGTSVGTTEDISGLAVGAYQLTVTDANSCTVTSSIFTVASGPSVTADFTTDVSFGTTPLVVTIDNNTTGATSYAWSFGNTQTSALQNPTPVTYINSGTYTITLVASNGTCTETYTVLVIAELPSTIVIPNIFSPNGDGLNDQFTIYSSGMKTLNVDIFNRWGQKVALIENVGQAWDGKLHNGDDASEGTYFYMLKAVGLDGKEYTQEGAMMLVK